MHYYLVRSNFVDFGLASPSRIFYSSLFLVSLLNKEVNMQKIYKVTLTAEERTELTKLVSVGKSNAQKIKRANILLAVNETEHGRVSDAEVAKQFHCHTNTVANIRERFVEDGLEAALERKKRAAPPVQPIFDGRAEAHLIRLACSTPPEGRSSWTMQLLADKCVELAIVEKTGKSTVHKVLKKTTSSLISKNVG
jgi:transposase